MAALLDGAAGAFAVLVDSARCRQSKKRVIPVCANNALQ